MFSSQEVIPSTEQQGNAETEGEFDATPVQQLNLASQELVTSTLNIRGNKFGQNLRPRTSPFNKRGTSDDRSGSHSPDSLAGTFTIQENRTERQTKIKLESLERRLRANEKARKEIEAEAEKWKSRDEKNGKRLPELEIELAELSQAKYEWMAKSQEIEVHNKQVTAERDEFQTKILELEENMKTFGQKMLTVFSETEAENLENNDISKLDEKIMKHQSKCLALEQENKELTSTVNTLTDKLSQNQDHVSALMGHLETNKLQSQEIHGICKKELEIRQDKESRINHDITMLNSTINEQKLELDMLRSEIRCLRSYSQEISTSNRNNIILLKSAETERKSLLETLGVLLNADVEPTESNIKKTIRDLVREKNMEQTKRYEAEKRSTETETILLDQAKQQRNALFRARTSEDELSNVMEKIDQLQQELLASDLERKNLEHRIEMLDKCILKISQLLNVNTGTVFDEIYQRIEDLLNQESVYRLVVNDNRMISENIIRGLQTVRKEIHGTSKSSSDPNKKNPVSTAAKIIQERSNTLKTIDKMDKLNKDLLATMTIETLRAADIEKTTLKKKMSEQEQRIRQLEREKKEGERIRSIIAKWETRNVPKPKSLRKTPSVEQIRPKSQASLSGLSHI